MRLFFVIDHLGSGGAQRQMVTLAVELKKRGHEVSIFVYHPDIDYFKREVDKFKIKIFSFRKTKRFSISIVNNLHKLIKVGNYDLVLSFLGTPNFYTELAKLRGYKVPVVVSIRNTYPFGKITCWRALKEQFHRLATHITVNSNHQRILMEENYTWIRSKISTIYNSVDLNKFKPGKFNKNSNTIEFLVVGTTRKLKNMIGIARALEICRNKYQIHPVVRWAGKIAESENDKVSYSQTKEFIRKNNLNSQWEWLGERSDIPKLLQKHHALIHGSFYEGLPNAICEALASGLPVLASDVGDHAFLVEEGESGFLFDPYDPVTIAQKIYKLSSLSDREHKRLSKNARSFAEKYLSTDVGVTAYENLFESLATGKR